MKIGIIINTNDPETVWNAFRFALASLLSDHDVKVFLIGGGVECEDIDGKYKIQDMIKEFMENNGKIFACGTCLKMRHRGIDVCPISTIHDMLHIVEESDKVLVFG